jgi:hypothetical protein
MRSLPGEALNLTSQGEESNHLLLLYGFTFLSAPTAIVGDVEPM